MAHHLPGVLLEDQPAAPRADEHGADPGQERARSEAGCCRGRDPNTVVPLGLLLRLLSLPLRSQRRLCRFLD
jgi:hypothetical protein